MFGENLGTGECRRPDFIEIGNVLLDKNVNSRYPVIDALDAITELSTKGETSTLGLQSL